MNPSSHGDGRHEVEEDVVALGLLGHGVRVRHLELGEPGRADGRRRGEVEVGVEARDGRHRRPRVRRPPGPALGAAGAAQQGRNGGHGGVVCGAKDRNYTSLR